MVYLDSSGTPTDPTTPDTEISKDGGAFADCTEEVTTITGSNGAGYLTLTGDDTNCSLLIVAAKVASGPKTTLLMGSPRVLASVGTGTLSAGSAGGGTLGTLLAYDVTGCFIKTTGGTGGGGTGGANNQARKIVTYNTSSGAFTVSPNWETTPSTDTTYEVLLPEGLTLGMLKAINPTTAGRTLDVSAGGEAGLDWANIGSPTTANNLSGTTINLVNTATTLTNDPTGVTTLLSRLTSARAGYLDNLNTGGVVATQADINALNQSASRRVILTTVGQFERPESGSVTYWIDARTYDGDGAAVNADSTPTLTATGITTGSLSANLSAGTNPATGVYRWTYTVSSGATIEAVRFDLSATISSSTFTMTVHTQVADFVAATFTTSDRTLLTSAASNAGNAADYAQSVDGKLTTARAGYLDNLQNGAVALQSTLVSTAADVTTIKTDTGNLVARITSTLFSGITSLAQWLGLLAGKQVGNTTARTELRATGAGSGTYDETTDALQAIRDRGDAAWTTGVGGGSGGATAEEIAAALAGQIPIVISPANTSQHIDIYKGDAYDAADGTGRTLSFTFQTGEAWPDSIDTAAFYCSPTTETLDNDDSAVGLDGIAMIVDTPTGDTRQVTLELTEAQTGSLTAGVNGYTFAIVANAAGNRAVLRSGTMTVRRDPTA